MLPREWSDYARAPHGRALVRRNNSISQAMGFWVPETTRGRTRAATAIVLDIHPGVAAHCPFEVGDAVLLSAGCGKELIFGLRGHGEDELWVVEPESVLCRITRSAAATDEGEHFLRNAKSLAARLPTTDDGRWDEGDPEGLR